jgi:hypothetical protein
MLRPKGLLVVVALLGVAGLSMLIAAVRLEMPVLIGPGLLLFAAGTAAAGVEAIARRYLYERSRASARTQTYFGPAAVLKGLVLLMLAAGLAVAGVAYLLGREEELLELLLARPGAALLALGAALCAAGAARVLGAREWRGSTAALLSGPERLEVHHTVLGVAGVARAPASRHRWVGGFRSSYARRPYSAGLTCRS